MNRWNLDYGIKRRGGIFKETGVNEGMRQGESPG